jgi:hypothetical protein
MKLISHLVLLILGAAIGLWYGVNHPTQAAKIAAHEKQIVAQAKVEILEKLHSSSTPTAPPSSGVTSGTTTTVVPGDKVQQMLDQSHHELDDANKALQNQGQ